MRIGILTGGGDCPGLNAAIRAVVTYATTHLGHSVVGFRHGWRGVAEGDVWHLSRADTQGLITRGGTMLGTARFHPHSENGGMEAVLATLEQENIEALICIGGDGTLNAAHEVALAGVKVSAIPKTIDNDVAGTDASIGFHTAVEIATDAVDRLRTTAESHDRIMVVEVMGRHSGWIAATAGLAGGAEVILLPEDPFDMDRLTKFLRHRHRAYSKSSVVVVAEGAVPAADCPMDMPTRLGQHGEIIPGVISTVVAKELEERTGFDTRVTVLGHVQRGGTPTPTDRLLGTRMGVAAVQAIHDGRSNVMTAQRGDLIDLVPLEDVAGKRKDVPQQMLEAIRALQ